MDGNITERRVDPVPAPVAPKHEGPIKRAIHRLQDKWVTSAEEIESEPEPSSSAAPITATPVYKKVPKK